ncbi:MAG: hypothetical protein KDK36_00660, partial [Leptospiraceae bacterium]|nr:hypothetical protein [Leptospiraceae bacterium]
MSITVSQGFAIISALAFVIDSYLKGNLGRRLKNRFFLTALFVYLALLPALFLHSDSFSYFFKALFKEEISDFWMCFVLLTGHYLSRKEENLRLFTKIFYISSGIILITGLISIFTPFRLAIFLQNGFSLPENSRLQHFAGNLWGIPTYLPIGLMNTHLTFGGILGMSFVGLFANFLYHLWERKIY